MKNANGYPQSVDYFIPTGKYAGLFTQAYGEKPQTIQIVFPDDDPTKVCNERYEYRDDDGRLIAAGDGETFQVWDGKKVRNIDNGGIPEFDVGNYQALPQSEKQAGRTRRLGNYVDIEFYCTVGTWRCRGMAVFNKGYGVHNPANPGNIRRYVGRTGICKGIIFDLNVQFATTQKPGDRSRFPVVSLVPNESADNVLKVRKAWEPAKQLDNE